MNIVKLFSRFIVACIAGLVLTYGAMADGNIPTAGGDIGDFGAWTTEHNRNAFTGTLSHDLEQFQSGFQEQLVHDYVPIEAKVGMAFMNGMALVGRVLDISLVRFMVIFIIAVFLFWVAFEGFRMIQGNAPPQKTITDIFKKGGLILIWVLILEAGPARIFMWAMGPIITVGTYMSDMILNAVANVAGANLPDTCGAIREYTAAHTAAGALIDADMAAKLMCVPTRLSGFFYTAVAVGFKWMLAGIGTSPFAFLMGAVFVVIFIKNIWQFALMALGVIADLFLGIFMLPFTALAETIGQTSYKGIAGDIFNGFLALFHAEKLDAQINRFIKAALYFVSLSIVVAVCAAIMSGVIDMDLAKQIPSLNDNGFLVTLLVGMLVAYLANQADKIAKGLGGTIDAGMGDKVGRDIATLYKRTKAEIQKYWKIYKDSKKSS